MTVVQLINPARFGGLETVVTLLAYGLREFESPVAVLAVVDQDTDEPKMLFDLRARGVPVEVLSIPARNYTTERKLISSALTKLNATVVHTHGYRMDVIYRTIHSPSRRNVWVSTLHGFTGGGRKNRLYEYLQLRSLRRADLVIGVSAAILERASLSGILQKKLRLIQNAVPPSEAKSKAQARAELGLDASRTWVGWVGRLGVEKDPRLFIHAIRMLCDPNTSGVMVGTGSLLEAIRGENEDLIREGRLVLAGMRSDAGTLMSAFDALVVSSVTEGTPLVVLEAMQNSVPVVAMAVGGLPDVIGEGAGVLVDTRSGPALARAIGSVLTDSRLRNSIVLSAKARIESKFSTATWLSTHSQLYAELSFQKRSIL